MTERLTIISSMATRRILAELAAAYKAKTGVKVDVTSLGGIDAAKRIAAGEIFDVVVLAEDALQKLARDGHVNGGSVRVFAHSPAAIAVPAGAARPATLDRASIQAFVRAARAVALSTGPSGKAVRALLVSDDPEKSPHIIEAPPGVPVAQLLVSGDAEVGFQQWSELLCETGIDVVGPLAANVLPVTTFSVGICLSTIDIRQSQLLRDDLTAIHAASVKSRHGMSAER